MSPSSSSSLSLSLQDRYAPKSICFGCGPSNSQGLRIKSFPKNEKVICEWQPSEWHEAFPGMLNGGIIGALLDCHSNWTAAWHLMMKNQWSEPPCTVTAQYSIELKKPTPSHQNVFLTAEVIESKDRKVVISALLQSNDEVCATCMGTFVAVKPGHPAFHRW